MNVCGYVILFWQLNSVSSRWLEQVCTPSWNQWKQICIKSFSIIWDQRQTSIILLSNLYVTFMYGSFMFMSTFPLTIQLVTCQSNKVRWHFRMINHSHSYAVGFDMWLLITSYCNGMANTWICTECYITTDTKTDSFMYLRFLHFIGSKNEQVKSITDCEKDKFNDIYAKYYSPTEHVAVKIVVLFKVVIFKHFVPKKCKQVGVKNDKLCGFKRYRCMYNMTIQEKIGNVHISQWQLLD